MPPNDPTPTPPPDNMPGGARRVVNLVRDLFRARYMRDYAALLPELERNMVWDAPPILTGRKGARDQGMAWGRASARLG